MNLTVKVVIITAGLLTGAACSSAGQKLGVGYQRNILGKHPSTQPVAKSTALPSKNSTPTSTTAPTPTDGPTSNQVKSPKVATTYDANGKVTQIVTYDGVNSDSKSFDGAGNVISREVQTTTVDDTTNTTTQVTDDYDANNQETVTQTVSVADANGNDLDVKSYTGSQLSQEVKNTYDASNDLLTATTTDATGKMTTTQTNTYAAPYQPLVQTTVDGQLRTTHKVTYNYATNQVHFETTDYTAGTNTVTDTAYFDSFSMGYPNEIDTNQVVAKTVVQTLTDGSKTTQVTTGTCTDANVVRYCSYSTKSQDTGAVVVSGTSYHSQVLLYGSVKEWLLTKSDDTLVFAAGTDETVVTNSYNSVGKPVDSSISTTYTGVSSPNASAPAQATTATEVQSTYDESGYNVLEAKTLNDGVLASRVVTTY